jgi:hypothetical protein
MQKNLFWLSDWKTKAAEKRRSPNKILFLEKSGNLSVTLVAVELNCIAPASFTHAHALPRVIEELRKAAE